MTAFFTIGIVLVGGVIVTVFSTVFSEELIDFFRRRKSEQRIARRYRAEEEEK